MCLIGRATELAVGPACTTWTLIELSAGLDPLWIPLQLTSTYRLQTQRRQGASRYAYYDNNRCRTLEQIGASSDPVNEGLGLRVSSRALLALWSILAFWPFD